MNDSNSRPTPAHQQLIASVLLAEIAGYEDRQVFEQIDLTSRCRQLFELGMAETLCQGLVQIQGESNTVLVFPGDPMDCLRFANWLENILTNDPRLNSLPLQFGINLGPLTLQSNERGEMQANGAAIDDARRVAQSGRLREVLMSRAFYTVLSRSTMNDRLLSHRAFISDEHDHSIAVYQIARTDSSVDNVKQIGESSVAIAPSNARGNRARRAVVAAAVLAMIGGITVYNRDAPQSIEQAREPVVHSVAIAPKPASSAPIVATAPAEPEPTVVSLDKAPMPAIAKSNVDFVRKITPEPKVTVQLAIKPWGEIYVDGKKVGVTPPLHNIKLPPGKREILVRNANFVPFQTTLDVQPESLLLVSHRFDK
jgi:hypothetical protein